MPDSGASASTGPARTRHGHFILPSFVLFEIVRPCRRRHHAYAARGCCGARANLNQLRIEVKGVLPEAMKIDSEYATIVLTIGH
jgi:hypothetical protein